jgi:NodT family efflux transporter outer membrane factor (OMF) lipoprotein
MMRIGRRPACLFVVIAATMVAGCAVTKPPDTPVIVKESLPETTEIPDEFAGDEVVDSGEVDDGWVRTFGDPQLVALVDEAIRNNRDLELAASQVDAAAAQLRAAGAALKPTVGYGLQATGQQIPGKPDEISGVGVGVSWEADIWGRLRTQQAAAEEALSATQADYDFARQAIAAATAKGWFAATQARMLLDLSDDLVRIYGETVEVVNVKYRVGRVTRQDVSLAEADLRMAEESRLQAEIAYKEVQRALETLLGRYPAAELDGRDGFVAVPPPIPVGLPSDLLERRPDLIASERRVAAAFNLVESAKAAKLPRFSISAGVGGLADAGSAVYQLGAGLFGPLYAGGALKAQVESADANQRAAMAAYGKAVLNAFREVENAIASEPRLERREALLEQVYERNAEALELAKVQYNVGRVDLLSVLQMQARTDAARLSLISIRAERLFNRVNLHQSLGGSFEGVDPNLVASTDEI